MKKFLVLVGMILVFSGSAAAVEPFACNMKALTKSERARHQKLSKTLLAAVQERAELPNGYGFRLPSSMLISSAEWISFERKCCPFFGFEIEQVKNNGPLWLRITGSEGIKPFII